MLQQVNGHSSGSDAHGGESLREDLQEFLGGEAPLHQLDDLTKVNPVTLETVLRCLQARYMADTFYTSAGCTLVALNPFKPIPQLYSPELMQEYHAAPQPQKLKPHIFTVGEQTYRNVKSLIEPVNQSVVVSGESGAGKGFPGGTVVRNLPANAGEMGSSPGLGRSHMLRSNEAREPQLLSLRSRASEPQLLKPMRLEPVLHNKRSHQNGSPRIAMKSSPHS